MRRPLNALTCDDRRVSKSASICLQADAVVLRLGRQTSSRSKVAEEETACILCGVRRDARVPAHVRLQRLLIRPKSIEQFQRGLPVVASIVPLEQDMHRDGDPMCFLDDGAGHEAAGEEPRCCEAWLDPRKPDADGRDTS